MNKCEELPKTYNSTLPVEEETTVTQPSQKDFSFCLPFGGKVTCTDGIITVKNPSPPANGTYNTITIDNGCISGLGTEELSVTVSSPCAPLATPCDCDGNGTIEISTQSGNIVKLDSTGKLYAGLSVKAGTGIKVTGNGTSSNPLTITAQTTSSKSLELQSGNAAITITGSGTSAKPYVITHKKQSSTQVIDGMSFDTFGHLISYTAPSKSALVKGVVGRDGVDVSQNASTGIVTVSLSEPTTKLNSGYLLGGFNVTFDQYNRVVGASRSIKLTAGTYAFGASAVTVNQYGSITAISGMEGEEITGTFVVQLNSSTTGWNKQITLGNTSFLLLSIDSPGTITVTSFTIDDTAVTGYVCGGNRYMALSSASYARGKHTLEVKGTIPAHSYITITLVSR